MRILVTGGAGFIGSHVVEAYVAAGHEVSVVDDLSGGKRANVNPRARFYQADIRSAEMRDIIAREQPEVLNHHAAQMDVRKSVADPRFDADVNVMGLLNLLELGRAQKLRRVLFASSGGTVYGEQTIFPAPEDHPKAPLCPYGITKLATEHYLHFYGVQYGLEWIAFRYGNVYGPRQNPHGEAGVSAIFAQKLVAGEQPIINGDGLQTRDYVFIADLVRANVAGLDGDYSGPLNIGTGIETSVVELFRQLQAVCRTQYPEQHGPAKPGEQRRSVVDPTRAGRVLGWRPTIVLAQGLAATVDFLRTAAVER